MKQLRGGKLLTQLRSLLPGLDVAAEASSILVAFTGSDLLVAARGTFNRAPAGSVLAAPGIALSGSTAAVDAATAQCRSGMTGAAGLLALAAKPAASAPIWMVLRGGHGLPLTGNAANLNRILSATKYVTVAATETGDWIEATAIATCHSNQEAVQLEQTVRAFVTLARLRDPVRITRDGNEVIVTGKSSLSAVFSTVPAGK